MFDAVLIANRGEIACRVIRTLKRLGIRAIAVYSDADQGALHVAQADQAIRIGPAPASESYLRADAILDAARRAGAQAIHPGYGFLAENAGFARACRDAGLIFVGPSPEAIETMGAKDRAKAVAAAAEVPLVPGHHGGAQDDASLLEAAHELGFPVLLKAVAGGGGKGMRVVSSSGRIRRRARRSKTRSAGGVRRRAHAARALPRRAAAHRGAGVRRPPRPGRASVRARLLGAAASSEGARGGAGTRHQRAAARGSRGDGGAAGARDRLYGRRHDRVSHGPERRVLLHGDEHASSSRASGDRNDHRARPRRVAAARRGGRAAALEPEGDCASRARHRGAPVRRGPGARLPAVDRNACPCPPAGLWPVGPGRDRRPGRRPHQPVLRSDARQDRRLGTGSRRRAAAPARGAFVRPRSWVSRPTSNSSRGWWTTTPSPPAPWRRRSLPTTRPSCWHRRRRRTTRPLAIAALWLLCRQRREAVAAAAAGADPHSPWHRVDGWRLNDVGHQTLRLRAAGEVVEIDAQAESAGWRLRIRRARADRRGRARR